MQCLLLKVLYKSIGNERGKLEQAYLKHGKLETMLDSESTGGIC